MIRRPDSQYEARPSLKADGTPSDHLTIASVRNLKNAIIGAAEIKLVIKIMWELHEPDPAVDISWSKLGNYGGL